MSNNITMDLFFDQLMDLVDVVVEKEEANIEAAAKICADAIEKEGVIHVFGSGHSIGFGLEMQNRIGSLAPIHTMDMADFVFNGKFTLEEFKDNTNYFERRPGIADQLLDMYDIRENDAFIVISNSGINGVVIDIAIHAKERGHKVIVVTSWQHTNAEDSRHPSGKKLYQLGDVMIDNCGPRGDALIETGGPEKICSVSSITGAFIAQTIATQTCSFLVEKGIELPVYREEIDEESKEFNKVLKEKYAGRV